MGAIVSLLLMGVALLVTPIVLSATGKPPGGFVTTALMVPGGILVLLGTALLLVKKLYQKTSASHAFVRTGVGGAKIVIDGGAFVVGFMHDLVWITLETLKLQINRKNESALLTQDNLLVDIEAEFFVHVDKTKESVSRAAQAFGKGMTDEAHVFKKIGEKLIDALRTAAVRRTLDELNNDRQKFIEEVTAILKKELEPNGLTLETATISSLGQTDYNLFKDNDVLHVQGKRKIAQIVQENLTTTNQRVREGEQARKMQDVETKKKILTYEQDQAQAEAETRAYTAKINADKNREAQEAQIASERAVEMANVQKAQTVQVAQQAQQQAVEVADRQKQQAVEVADRQKQQAVADAEKLTALAEKDKAIAEAEREKARQAIQTVQVVEDAERKKKQQVLSAEAAAETKYVTEQRQADASAYAQEKAAEAAKTAAMAQAEATRTGAEADRDAKVAHAAGQQAVEMVPINVQKEAVSVEKRRLDEVTIPELQARDKHGKVAQDFEIAKLQVTLHAEVQKVIGQALATAVGQIDAQVVGTPEQVGTLVQKLADGMGLARSVEGFMQGLSPELRSSLGSAGGQILGAIGALAKKAGLTPQEIAAGGQFIDASKGKGGKPGSEDDAGNGA